MHINMRGYQNQIRIFDYAKFAEPFRDILKSNAEHLARQSGVQIEYIRKGNVRKEAIVEAVIKKRGTHVGLVHILSVMEGCTTYKPWHGKISTKTFLKYDQSKCLTYYFYFIDEVLGLCYVVSARKVLLFLSLTSKTMLTLRFARDIGLSKVLNLRSLRL